jgi:porin
LAARKTDCYLRRKSICGGVVSPLGEYPMPAPPILKRSRPCLLAAAILAAVAGPVLADDAPRVIDSSLPPELADPGGFRRAYEEHGFRFGAKYIGEVLANARGGLKTGAIYDGRLRLSIDGDLEKAFGLPGLSFHVNASQLHGVGLTRYYVGNLLPVSNMEATPATRLFDLWLQQSLFDDRLNIRLGQIAADGEFLTRDWGKIFINNSFGWPGHLINDLPSGGAAFPFAAPGVRVALKPTDHVTLLAAVIDGDPAGPQRPFDDPDPQMRNRAGVNFRLSDPPFVIGEAQYSYEIAGLPGVAKGGGWRHFGKFADFRLGTDFLSLADPNANGTPLQRRGDGGFYGLIDQQIYKSDDKSAGVFLRGANAAGDRNLLDLYIDAGATFGGFAPMRADDLFGVAFGYGRIGRNAQGLDRDVVFYSNPFAPVRSSEMALEGSYIAQIASGWTLQPDVQYIVRPGGHAPDPRDTNGVSALRNSLVVGVRTLIRY